MPNDSATSDDEKSAHQQRIHTDEEVRQQCDKVGHDWITYSRPPMRAVTGRQCKRCRLIQESKEPWDVDQILRAEYECKDRDDDQAMQVMIAEVRRLREELAEYKECRLSLLDKVDARDAKLARVEAVPDQLIAREKELHDARMDFTASDAASIVETALRDELIRPPSKAEPYNGY